MPASRSNPKDNTMDTRLGLTSDQLYQIKQAMTRNGINPWEADEILSDMAVLTESRRRFRQNPAPETYGKARIYIINFKTIFRLSIGALVIVHALLLIWILNHNHPGAC